MTSVGAIGIKAELFAAVKSKLNAGRTARAPPSAPLAAIAVVDGTVSAR